MSAVPELGKDPVAEATCRVARDTESRCSWTNVRFVSCSMGGLLAEVGGGIAT
ncbi:MAG: hypothetical protein HYU77_11460 [Betaproteobacteria bacterium]|nr:hypothetical protein [Betaproteobacteria bacterium]